MRLIGKDLKTDYAVEFRRRAFKEFVRDNRDSKYPGSGIRIIALYNDGFSDSFGPVVYERGMYNHCWIVPDNGKNSKVAVFATQAEAQEYGKSLLPILKDNGFPGSSMSVDRVAIHKSTGRPFAAILAPRESYEEDRYILRFKVKK